MIGGLTATKGTLDILPPKTLCAIGQIPYFMFRPTQTMLSGCHAFASADD